jgi:hypothetical protein
MRPFFSSDGAVGVTVEAAQGRPAAAPCTLGFGAGGRRKVAGWAMRVGWAGRKAEAQWEGEGKSAGKKKETLGRKAGWAESDGENSFPNKIWFFNILRLWKFAQGDLGGILTWGFFLNSSRLFKDFRKIKYVMPCYASLGKN